MLFCDSHCHLESARFDADRELVIERAYQAGVDTMISCGSDLGSSMQQVALAAGYPGIYAAVGIHGHQAKSAVSAVDSVNPVLNEGIFQQITELTLQRGVVALGELGLDYHYEFSPRAVQKMVLTRQLELALQVNLPVILHNRESDDDLMHTVGPFAVRGVLHCFLGSPGLLDWAVERGFYIGAAGPITYPRMDSLLEMLKRVPLERVLIETDSPYLAPQPVRGKRNEPAHVKYIAEKLAQVKGISLAKVSETTRSNARECFGIRDAG